MCLVSCGFISIMTGIGISPWHSQVYYIGRGNGFILNILPLLVFYPGTYPRPFFLNNLVLDSCFSEREQNISAIEENKSTKTFWRQSCRVKKKKHEKTIVL